MLLAHCDVVNQAMIIQPLEMTVAEKIKALAEKLKFTVGKTDIRFVVGLAVYQRDKKIVTYWVLLPMIKTGYGH